MSVFVAVLFLATSCGKNANVPVPVRIDVNRVTDFTGRGNDGETLIEVRVRPEGGCRVNGMTLRLNSGSEDISRLSVACNGRRLESTTISAGTDSVTLRLRKTITDVTTFSITADIKPDAVEGHLVSVDLVRISVDGRSFMPLPPRPGGREILLCRKLLFTPGDYGSIGWRIPTIRQLSDGTLLVVNDRRNDNEEDLPGCIDVAYRYSSDGGKTWSEPGYVARNDGYLKGFGDPGLGELPDGTVVCAFAGGEDFFHSAPGHEQHSYVCFSYDHGRSWTEPRDITSQIWGPDAVKSPCKEAHSSFFTSGNYLVLQHGEHKGRLLIANVCQYPGDDWLSNHAVFTDDGGKTWQVSEVAVRGCGDEAKMVELPDGSIIMSVRTTGDRIWVKSYDGGVSWPERGTWADIHTTACNGDFIAYNDSILLHSIPMSMHREDVGILLSFDGGRTWPESKLVSPGSGQYSSLTVLPDGTIGAYIAKNVVGCELWYQNFSLEWLRRKQSGAMQEMNGVQLWPGGPLWAECNLGASSQEEPGDFFSWGETRGKQLFGWGRYCGTSDDAAEAILGKEWRMPSKEDFKALQDKCSWTWTEVNGRPGYRITGECGSIFLPAGGYVSGNRHRHYGDVGQYWTSSAISSTAAEEFWFDSEFVGDFFSRGRDNGLPIRGVKYPHGQVVE